MKQYDIIIVGGGPAASILAWKLPKNVRALIVEKRFLLSEERLYEREKSCGGMLDETAQKALAKLRIPIPKKVLVGPQVFAIRAIDFENQMERYYQKRYVNIDRARFDAYLLNQAAQQKNVTIWQGAQAFNIKEEKDGVSIWVRKETGEKLQIKADYLVGADGGGSMIRKELLKKKPRRHEPHIYASIQEWHPMPKTLPYYVSTFHESVTDFYSWVIPEGDQMIIGSAIPAGKKVRDCFQQFKKDLTEKGFDVSSPTKVRGAIVLRPRAWGSVWSGRRRIFLVGEAAGLISPSSAEGISFALRSGEKLAKAFEKRRGLFIRLRYGKELLPLKISIALKSLKSPIMYQKRWRGLVFKTRALSFKMEE